MNHSPMTPILIPPAALEAGARALCKEARLFWPDLHGPEHDIMRAEARAAFLAMIGNWPGMTLHQQDINAQYSYFVLPLTEKPDDKT